MTWTLDPLLDSLIFLSTSYLISALSTHPMRAPHAAVDSSETTFTSFRIECFSIYA